MQKIYLLTYPLVNLYPFLTSNLFTRYLLPIINEKTLAGSQGFSGAYETRTRDLLRDRQAF